MTGSMRMHCYVEYALFAGETNEQNFLSMFSNKLDTEGLG